MFEEASSAFAALLAMKAEMHELESRLGDPSIPETEHEAMLSRYSDLQDGFRLHEGYSIELKTATVLRRARDFDTSDFERPTETFSGGWQMRIALAKLLLGQPNLLLLDEPTNHLDLEARNWLETYLNEYPHAVILVSHDRFFLDAVVTRIADLTLRTLTDYHTNYSGYLVEHHERIEALRKAKREQDDEVGARQDVHRPLPLPGDQGVAGPEPDQGAREDRPDRRPAGTRDDPFHLPGLRKERPHGARAEARAQGLRRSRRLRRSRTSTSNAATASPWSVPTAPANRR